MQKLQDYIIGASNHLHTTVVFNSSVPPLIDNLYFNTLMQNISSTAFFEKLNQSLENVYRENLSLSELTADEILPKFINDNNYIDVIQHVLTTSTKQNLTGDIIIDNLETEVLNADMINGIPLDDLHRILMRVMSFRDNVSDMDPPIEMGSLRVLGKINVSSINGIDIFGKDDMPNVIFRENVWIEDLEVTGFVNGLNLSRIVDDAVKKTDGDVTFTGRKIFQNFTCEYLDVRFLNDHFVGDILNADHEQTLKGPVTVTGTLSLQKYS